MSTRVGWLAAAQLHDQQQLGRHVLLLSLAAAAAMVLAAAAGLGLAGSWAASACRRSSSHGLASAMSRGSTVCGWPENVVASLACRCACFVHQSARVPGSSSENWAP